mmetsp:Transcript_52323/g.106674  ORF Transcript_52323/g.106674 Transcript_52323/m.106674 type:complete len:85 (-) Transcript_52323:83-337(-)
MRRGDVSGLGHKYRHTEIARWETAKNLSRLARRLSRGLRPLFFVDGVGSVDSPVDYSFPFILFVCTKNECAPRAHSTFGTSICM